MTFADGSASEVTTSENGVDLHERHVRTTGDVKHDTQSLGRWSAQREERSWRLSRPPQRGPLPLATPTPSMAVPLSFITRANIGKIDVGRDLES